MKLMIVLFAVAALAVGQVQPTTPKAAGSRTQASGGPGSAKAQDRASEAAAEATPRSVLDFTVKDIDGDDVSLKAYRGKVLLIVNVASKCGLTPQYKGLQTLHDRYTKDGLAILGFPANEFGRQEPGTDADIKQFCTDTYGVEFDMFSKVVVKGDDKCPLYDFLTSAEHNGDFGGEIKWNFTKFLIDRAGEVVARFEPRTKPLDRKVVDAIERELKQH
jgi:glutathione peroxidase